LFIRSFVRSFFIRYCSFVCSSVHSFDLFVCPSVLPRFALSAAWIHPKTCTNWDPVYAIGVFPFTALFSATVIVTCALCGAPSISSAKFNLALYLLGIAFALLRRPALSGRDLSLATCFGDVFTGGTFIDFDEKIFLDHADEVSLLERSCSPLLWLGVFHLILNFGNLQSRLGFQCSTANLQWFKWILPVILFRLASLANDPSSLHSSSPGY